MTVEDRERVFGDDRGLLARRRRGLGVGRADGVAEAEDVRIPDVTQGVGIHIDPASLVRERTRRHHLGRRLGRADVQHVEGTGDAPHALLGVRHLERGLPTVPVDGDQAALQVEVDAIALDIRHERRHVVRHAEQHRGGRVEFSVYGVQPSMPPPMIAGQVRGLLRRAGAFDGHGRLGEQRPSVLQRLDELPGVGGELSQVVGRHTVSPKRLGQALHGTPVQAQTGRGDQHAVGQPLTVVEQDAVALGLEATHRGADPGRASGHEAAQGALRRRAAEYTGPDEGPARLVVVQVLGLDDGDAQARAPSQQARGRRKARRTASDHDNVVRWGEGQGCGRRAHGGAVLCWRRGSTASVRGSPVGHGAFSGILR